MNLGRRYRTPLEEAIDNNDLYEVEVLCSKGADLERRSPLVHCIEHNRLSIAKFLVEIGANTTLGFNGYPPLHYAISKGNFEMAKLLLDNGADFTMYECLEGAIEADNLAIVRELIERGVDVHNSDGRSTVPIMFATRKERCDILKLLVENGVDVNFVDSHGNTPLIESIRRGNLVMTEYLINTTKIDLKANIHDHQSKSPIMCAMRTRNCDVLKLLLKEGANVNFVDPEGDTPLIKSVRFTNVKITKCLIENKADLNVKNAKNETPLSVALAKSDFRTFKLLLESGADPKLANEAIEAMAKRNRDFAAYMARTNSKNIDDPQPKGSAGAGHEAGSE